MTDQIPADKVREILATRGMWASDMIAEIEALLPPPPPPPLPTLAGMSPVERDACRWMQADTETWGRVVIVCPITVGGGVILLDRGGDVIHEDHASVTPRPDLPCMEWPDEQPADPALAATIAGMREEWGVSCGGEKPGAWWASREEADQCAKRMGICIHYPLPIVVVRRYVTEPEVDQ